MSVEGAQGFYREILTLDPRHADAIHLLGVIAHQTGKHDIAIDPLDQSRDNQPGDAMDRHEQETQLRAALLKPTSPAQRSTTR